MVRSDELPSALDRIEDVQEKIGGQLPVFFLDFDGTLSPIVEHPSQARLVEGMREVLVVLTAKAPVVVVSGRTVEDVRERVGVEGILYAGEHGFDLEGFLASRIDVPYPQGLEDALDRAEHALRSTAKGIEGAWVERKRFSVVAHHREAGPEGEGALEGTVEDVLKEHAPLGGHRGREVFEVVPDVDWDKGQAVAGLLGVLGLEASSVPVYVGDDVTDEHAFEALPEGGIGVLVRSEPRPTAATYVLEDPAEVRVFLEALIP